MAQLFDDFGNNNNEQDGFDVFGGSSSRNYLMAADNEGGGGSTGGGGVRITQSNYVLNIKSNIRGAFVLINGEISAYRTPSQLTISKQELIEGGSKTITLSKNGYVSNEKYVISLNTNGTPITPYYAYNGGYGNLSQIGISVRYYINNIEQRYIQNDGSSKELSFTLSKSPVEIVEPTDYNIKFLISGKGNPVSVVKNSTTNATFFPNIGESSYTDKNGTKYKISSSDTSLYRIVRIIYNRVPDKVGPITEIAGDGESLDVDILLNTSYEIQIETEEIEPQLPVLNPQIELVKTDARTYNINSEVGVPLMFRKNEDVEAITIIVGDDIIEFDDLDNGNLCGITIPHDVFENIGKYNIKIYPFSLDDYENQVRPAPIGDIIEPKRVKIKYDTSEIPKPDLPKLTDRFNRYSTSSNNISNGLSGRNRRRRGFFGRRLNLNQNNSVRNIRFL